MRIRGKWRLVRTGAARRADPGSTRPGRKGPGVVLYLRQGRVPSFVLPDDPPALADELAALRRNNA